MAEQLVGAINTSWQDMSSYVVHFTKATSSQSEYETAMSILYVGKIEARNRFGIGKDFAECPRSVCFSEAPLHQLNRLADNRGSYGVGFRKEYLVERGGGPILYAYKNTPQAMALSKLVAKASGNPNDPIWQVASFVDRPGQYAHSSYFFEWEREWRHQGDLDFGTADPAFLIIPEQLHTLAREFFDDAQREQLGPNYQCPYIDPYWPSDKIQAVLGANAN